MVMAGSQFQFVRLCSDWCPFLFYISVTVSKSIMVITLNNLVYRYICTTGRGKIRDCMSTVLRPGSSQSNYNLQLYPIATNLDTII